MDICTGLLVGVFFVFWMVVVVFVGGLLDNLMLLTEVKTQLTRDWAVYV